jgi:hypothetical protein
MSARKKVEYNEGPAAGKRFEDAMRYAFTIPKEKAPVKPKPKHRKKTGKDAS